MSVDQALRDAMPSLVCDGDEPIFNEPWEARVFAMAVKLNEAGHFTWSEWAENFGARIANNTKEGEPLSYYQLWMKTLETMMLEKQVISADEVVLREQEWQEACLRTPHGEAIEL